MCFGYFSINATHVRIELHLKSCIQKCGNFLRNATNEMEMYVLLSLFRIAYKHVCITISSNRQLLCKLGNMIKLLIQVSFFWKIGISFFKEDYCAPNTQRIRSSKINFDERRESQLRKKRNRFLYNGKRFQNSEEMLYSRVEK